MSSRVVLTYGSFDMFHQGHAQLLQRLSTMGTELIVGCSTDAYNEKMGVPAANSYAQRRLMLESCRFVSGVFAEQDWDQKYTDIINYNVSVLRWVMTGKGNSMPSTISPKWFISPAVQSLAIASLSI